MPKQPEKPLFRSSRGRLISFDPTVHMGHIITAATVAGTAAIMWGTTISDIRTMKEQIAKHDQWIEAVSKRENDDYNQVLGKMDTSIGQLRNDMNAWFIHIDQKIDGKADKP